MKLYRRKHGSQRAMAPITLELVLNTTGESDITFKGADGIYYVIQPDTLEEHRKLLSEVHIAHHNWNGE